MAGMRRWVFRIVSALSLALCLATVVLWVRNSTTGTAFGYEVDTLIHDPGPGPGLPRIVRKSYYLSIDRRAIAYAVYREDLYGKPHGWRFFHNGYPTGGSNEITPEVEFLGFAYASVEYQLARPETWREWTVPFWALILAFAFPPTLVVRSIVRKHRRQRRGWCPSCGYDLRATPDRCPECGAAPITSSSTPPR
jgi:hypothetical protein